MMTARNYRSIDDLVSMGQKPKPGYPMAIIGACILAAGITKNEFFGGIRNRRIVHSRWAAILLLRRHTRLSNFKIALYMSRDHTTIMHAVKKLQDAGKCANIHELAEKAESIYLDAVAAIEDQS